MSKKYFNPYREYPTDLNFCDIHGKSLLHYAAEQGLFEEVKQLIAQGANINLETVDWPEDQKTAIIFALEAGQLEIAEYLYQQGASCSKISVEKITHPQCREWLLNAIKAEIHGCCKLSENAGIFSLGIPDVVHNTKFFKFDIFSSADELLTRIIEINGLDYLKGFKNSYSFNPEVEGKKLLCFAAANNHLEIVKFLLDEAGVPINPVNPYTTSVLQAAISANQLGMAKYLVSRGADINWQDNNKYNALMVAVKCKNKEAVEWLLKQKIDVNQTDVHGNHLLYLAIEAGDEEILKLLLSNEEIKSQLMKENIYGHSAVDMAVFKNQPEIIALLSSVNKRAFPVGASLGIEIDHHSLIKRMFYCLRLCYFSAEFFPIIGECNGFSYSHNHNQDERDYFFSTLELFRKWTGGKKNLYLFFADTMPQAKYYKNLYELFYQKINDILWFQHSTFNKIPGKPDTFPKYEQNDREKQYALIGNEKDKAPHRLCQYGGELDVFQIEEILTYFKRMPVGTRLEIGGSKHSTSAYINEQGEIIYYDPRFPHRAKPFKDVKSWLKTIIDFKFINIGFYPTKKDGKFSIETFFFTTSKNLPKFNENFHIFSAEEYSQPFVESFSGRSPNQFTPLHVAVLTRSLASVERLLTDGYCNVNAKDCNGNTVLDLAISFNFKEAVDLLLVHPAINLEDKTIAKILGNDGERYFNPTLLDCLSYSIKENKFSLAKGLIKKIKKEQLSVDSGNRDSITPLSIAIQSKADEIVKELIFNGAKWGTVCENEFGCRVHPSAMDLVISQYEYHFPFMMKTLLDVNEKDDHGSAAIHYAANSGKIALMKDLIDKAADIQATNKIGYTPLGIIIDSMDSFDESKFISLVKMITGHVNFSLSGEKASCFYKLIAYSANKNVDLPFNANIQSNSTGNTFLHHIVKNYSQDKKQTIEILLKNGASFDIQNKDGKTAYELASELGNSEVVSVFDQYKRATCFKPVFSENSETLADQTAGSSLVLQKGIQSITPFV